MKRLNVGVIGLGRLGRVYARDLAGRIPETKLVAVADPIGNLAKDMAEEFDVAKSYTDPLALIDDKAVDAIVIDTTGRSIDDVVARVLDVVRSRSA